MGDRGGGRESKKGSLRKSSKNPGCAAGKAKSQKKVEDDVPTASLPCPLPGVSTCVDFEGSCEESQEVTWKAARALTQENNRGGIDQAEQKP